MEPLRGSLKSILILVTVSLFIVTSQSAQAASRPGVMRVRYTSENQRALRYLKFDPFTLTTQTSTITSRSDGMTVQSELMVQPETADTALRTTTLADSSDTVESSVSAMDSVVLALGGRPPIRVPYRPPLRSPYKPPLL